MIVLLSKWKHPSGLIFRCKTWRCCTYLWELLLSNRFPERENWNPICPTCGCTI